MTTFHLIELRLLGIGGGFLAGLLGIGGGMVLVPFLTFMFSSQGVESELTVKMAIATSMAVIIFTSISSVRAHHKRGAVRWDIVRKLAPGIVIGSMIGSVGVFSILKGAYLARSEEHTSELQSLMRISYAVFCLKKKTKTKCNHMT